MLKRLTCISPPEILEHETRVMPCPSYEIKYAAGPDDLLPVVHQQQERAVFGLANWGIDHRGKKEYTISLNKIMSRKPHSIWFRANRCAIPANCFISQDQSRTLLIRILKERNFLIGAVCVQSDTEIQFAVLTTESADVLQDVLPESPVIISSHKADKWVREKRMIEVMQIADRTGNKWYDYYPISSEILTTSSPNGSMLKPTDVSYREWQEQQEKIMALDTSSERFNRNNSKGRH